jgi:hypothetical protein
MRSSSRAPAVANASGGPSTVNVRAKARGAAVPVSNVALPALRAQLGAGPAQLQWVVDAYTLTLAVPLLLGGALGDRLGRRALFRTGLTLFGFGSLGCALAPSPDVLIGVRVLQACGAALLQPSALSTITGSIDNPGQRARAIGVWAGVFGLAAAVGPLVGGLLIDTAGWRWIFLINLPVVTAALLFTSSLYWQQVRHASALGTGLALLPATLGIAVVSPIAGRLIHRLGARVLLIAAGLALATAAALLIAAAGHAYLPLRHRVPRVRHRIRAREPADNQHRRQRPARPPGRRRLRAGHHLPADRQYPRRRPPRLRRHPARARSRPRGPAGLLDHHPRRCPRQHRARALHAAAATIACPGSLVTFPRRASRRAS